MQIDQAPPLLQVDHGVHQGLKYDTSKEEQHQDVITAASVSVLWFSPTSVPVG